MNQKEQYSPEVKPSLSERNKKIRKIALSVIGFVLAGATLAGASGCTSQTKGNPFGDVDPKIESITLHNGARLRQDPAVPDKEDVSNIVMTTDETITVNADKNIIVNPDTTNGTWYGIPADSLKRIDPDLNVSGDNDGIIWVNKQRATTNEGSETSN